MQIIFITSELEIFYVGTVVTIKCMHNINVYGTQSPLTKII